MEKWCNFVEGATVATLYFIAVLGVFTVVAFLIVGVAMIFLK